MYQGGNVNYKETIFTFGEIESSVESNTSGVIEDKFQDKNEKGKYREKCIYRLAIKIHMLVSKDGYARITVKSGESDFTVILKKLTI